MRRMERWIYTFLVVHGVLLVVTQLLVQQFHINVLFNPVYEYIGVFEQSDDNILKTLDHVLNNVLSF